jgi:hypothetical protein
MDIDESGGNVIAACIDNFRACGQLIRNTADLAAIAVKRKDLAAQNRIRENDFAVDYVC